MDVLSEVRTMRADARANRDAILTAAAEAFSAKGIDATFEDIAQTAGVGRATLYRHFPSRDELFGALFERAVDEIERRSTRLPGGVDPLDHFLAMAVEVLVEHVPLIDTLRAHGPLADEVVEPLKRRLETLLADPLAAAMDAGWVRREITVTDLRVLISMLTSAVRSDVSGEDTATALRLAKAAISRSEPNPPAELSPPTRSDHA